MSHGSVRGGWRRRTSPIVFQRFRPRSWYKRSRNASADQGILRLLRVLEIATGKVTDACYPRHREPPGSVDSLLGSGDQADQIAQPVQGLDLDRWPASAVSVQSMVVIPIHLRRRATSTS